MKIVDSKSILASFIPLIYFHHVNYEKNAKVDGGFP